MPKILVVEDDENLAVSVREALTFEGHKVDWVADGGQALEHLRVMDYDLAILDWQLPGKEGVEVCSAYRQSGGQTLILMLTGMSSIDQKETGLNSGADDYLTKPFHMRELIARVKSLLRRPARVVEETVEAGCFTLNTHLRQALRNGEPLQLQPHEYAVLEFFFRHPNQIITPEALLRRVWDTESEASLDSVYTCINRLRKKLDPVNKEILIRTVRGVGYTFVPPS